MKEEKKMKLKTKGKSPGTKRQQEHMRIRQLQNRKTCGSSGAENWMEELLDKTDRKWTRQARWGWRVFDFWNHELGIAIEVDGPEHEAKRERRRDAYNFIRSGIVVLRVPNWDEAAARRALDRITDSSTWNERRQLMGLSVITT